MSRLDSFVAALKASLTVQDSWTGPDKIKHLGAGFVAAVVVTIVAVDPFLGFAAGAAVAAGKELWDAANSATNTASVKDFVVTVVGAVGGSVVGNFIIDNWDQLAASVA
jgi:uncharacterized protein YfiM (DUF2279 family)